MRFWLIAMVLAICATAAAPARADEALRAELSAVVERYYGALRAGDFDGWMAVSSAEMREQIATGFASEEERQAFLEWQKTATPERFEVQVLEVGADGTTATLLTVVSGKRPPDEEGGEWVEARNEASFDFVKEADGWKVAAVLYGFDPSAIRRSENDAFEPIEAYDTDVATSLGGRIVRTEFRDDHTLVVVRLMDEEDFVYLPSRQELQDLGFNPDLLVPNATVEVEGHPHRSDEFKVWATGLSVL